MITNFTADREAAASTDQSYVDRVNASGKYIAYVYQVSTEETMGSAQYVQFDFKMQANEFGNFQIFVTKKDGSHNFGADIMDAIQVICGVPKGRGQANQRLYRPERQRAQDERLPHPGP